MGRVMGIPRFRAAEGFTKVKMKKKVDDPGLEKVS